MQELKVTPKETIRQLIQETTNNLAKLYKKLKVYLNNNHLIISILSFRQNNQSKKMLQMNTLQLVASKYKVRKKKPWKIVFMMP